jgi:hypothetical protein
MNLLPAIVKDLYLLILKVASCKVLIGTLKSAAVKQPILYTVYIARPETGEDLFLKRNTRICVGKMDKCDNGGRNMYDSKIGECVGKYT